MDYLGGLGEIKRVLKYLFICFGCAGFSLLPELCSGCGEQGSSLVAVAGIFCQSSLLWGLLLLWSGLRCSGLQ